MAGSVIQVFLLTVIVAVVVTAENEDSSSIRVTIAQGVLQGTKKTSAKGQEYLSFTGIRYGKPPTGDLRFKQPEPADKWEGTLDASEEVKCFQNEDHSGNGAGGKEQVIGQDDCLALNVFSKNIPVTGKYSLKPVMVWIHGGGFQLGASTTDFYGPDFLIDEDVVIVSINYRLGVLGFLSTGDDVIPGNMGMWDQVLALKWVRKNIKAFGGDPDNVTIFGESAGGMSVSHLVLSPAASGLFHKAIVQSGPPNSHFGKSEKHPAYYARTLAATHGCDPEASTKDIYSCLNKLDGPTLIKPLFQENEFDNLNSRKMFKPVVDDYATQSFLPKEPLTLIDEGRFNKVPLIVGSNRDEGLILMNFNKNLRDDVMEHFDQYIPNTFLYRETDSHDKGTAKFAQMVKEEIFQGQVPDLDTEDKYKFIELHGDGFANYASTKFARMMAAKSTLPVYEYRYHHVGSFTLNSLLGGGMSSIAKFIARYMGRFVGLDLFSNKEWSCHADELFLMWKPSFIPFDTVYTDEDKKVSAAMVRMWTDFAKHGDPTPKGDKWLPVKQGKDSKHLEITADGPTLKTDSAEYKKRADFWERVYKDHPPLLHWKESPTFKNTKLYNKKVVGDSKAKEEL